MRKRLLCRLIAVCVFSFLGVCTVWAQGNTFGLGNSAEQDMLSLSNRIFNLEERSRAFQFNLNVRGDIGEVLGGEERSGDFRLNVIRPEFLGSLGKWSYRIRLNMNSKSLFNDSDGTTGIANIVRIFYNSDNWIFSFGKSPLNYGTFEFEWNPANVLYYYEFQKNFPNASGVSSIFGYKLKSHLLTFELANAERLPVLADSPSAQIRFAPVNHQMQYSLTWRGDMFGSRLKTIWSYTLRHEAKDCVTNLLLLGTSFSIGKFNFQVDYNGAFGKLDYLGLVTSDAKSAGVIGANDLATNTQYQQWVVDLGYWPTKRWNLFVKLGENSSSSSDFDQLRHYRKTYECTASAQYFLDTSQEVRIGLSYYGRTTDYKSGINLGNHIYNRIELSFICRLKVL